MDKYIYTVINERTYSCPHSILTSGQWVPIGTYNAGINGEREVPPL